VSVDRLLASPRGKVERVTVDVRGTRTSHRSVG